MEVYTYFLRERPPTPGAIPKEGLIEVYEYPHPIYDPMDQHMIYGYANYDRRLTKDEIRQYELLPQEA
jgi:hypothetical protein